VPYMDAN